MPFRVLALDGGGVWSLVQARALAAIYSPQTTGHEVLAGFDLAAANSGGAIVLGALAANLPLDDLANIFKTPQKLKEIFASNHSLFDWLLHTVTTIGPKYSTKKKQRALEAMLGPAGRLRLSDAAAAIPRPCGRRSVHLLFTSFDYDRLRARFFRSSRAGGRGWGQGEQSDVRLAQAIGASADPPIKFFDQPAEFGGERFWDGGIAGCNNPVLAAVTEAKVLTEGSADIVALSIGSGTVMRAGPPADDPPSPYVQPREAPCVVADIAKLAGSVLDDPPDIATFLAHVMAGGIAGLPDPLESRIARMNPLVRPVMRNGAWEAPGGMTADDFTFLAGLDIDSIAPNQVDAIDRYAGLWLDDIAPNQPIRMNGDTFECELGHRRFSGALKAWRQLYDLPDQAPSAAC